MFDIRITNLISASLFGTEASIDSRDLETVFEQMKQQAVAVLPAGLLTELPLSEELRTEWKKHIYRQIFHFQTLARAEQELLHALDELGVCTLVLKGTSAARYYPTPQYRTMGDIDLLIKPENHQQAAECLQKLGYVEDTNFLQTMKDRHRSFKKGNITVELHRYFAEASTPIQNEVLDRYLFADMVPLRHTPTDLPNGLVLIEHIAQHLETGIGLRQMVDWMMYVNAVLDDEMWEHSFRAAAQATGMEKLAITVTRMCQMYLGLPKSITWPSVADDTAASDLMTYVLESGNFGNKREKLYSGTLTRLPPITKPATLFRYLQHAGLLNWPAAQKHRFLKPFAWAYQLNHYIEVVAMNNMTLSQASKMREERKRRRELFDKIGIRKE